MLDKATVRTIALKYADEVKKVLNPSFIVLFGSYVDGSPNELSDIDIAIIMHDYQGNWLNTYSMLFTIKRHVNLDIEPHLLDETRDNSGFVEHVMKTGVLIYQAV